MNKSTPHDNRPNVFLFKEKNGNTLAMAGEVAVRFKRICKVEEFKDRTPFPIEQSDIQASDYFKELYNGSCDMFLKEADSSVIIPTARLLEILHAVESKWVRVDLLPDIDELFDKDAQVDAVRITEIPTPQQAQHKHPPAHNDSAVMFGAMRSESTIEVKKPRKFKRKVK